MKQLVIALALVCGFAAAQTFTARTSVMNSNTSRTYVIGVVRTTEPVQRVEVFVEFLDASGQIVSVASGDAFLGTADAYEDIPFVVTTEGAEEATDYRIDAQGEPADEVNPLLPVSDVRASESRIGTRVTGIIENPHDEEMEVGRVVAAGFVGARIVGAGQTFPLLTIPAGETRRFEVNLTYEAEEAVDYRVWAEAD